MNLVVHNNDSLSELAKTRQKSDMSNGQRSLKFVEKRQLIRQEIDRNGRVITIYDYIEKFT